jgi:hypothetical protein
MVTEKERAVAACIFYPFGDDLLFLISPFSSFPQLVWSRGELSKYLYVGTG